MTVTNYAVAPGEYLEEWLEDEGLSQQKVADALGCSRKQVNEIINGRAPITPDTAFLLERVVGIPARTWLKREALYREDLKRIEEEEKLAQHIDEIHPSAIAYLKKIDALTVTKRNPGRLVSEFLSFHRCGTWDAYTNVYTSISQGDYGLAALKDKGKELDPTLLMSWIRAGELTETFEKGKQLEYRSENLEALLPALRERTATPDNQMLADVTQMLADVGVIFLMIEPPRNLPLSGITRWLDKRIPVIQQTARRRKDGFIIWTLFHEIGHLLNDPRGEMHLEYSSQQIRNSQAEKNANAFAKKILFGDDGLLQFSGLTSNAEIIAKSHEIGIAPGVAIHQMHRTRMLSYQFGNKLTVDLSGNYTQ